jgi:hypothetical protein
VPGKQIGLGCVVRDVRSNTLPRRFEAAAEVIRVTEWLNCMALHPKMNQCHPVAVVIDPLLKIVRMETKLLVKKQPCCISIEA